MIPKNKKILSMLYEVYNKKPLEKIRYYDRAIIGFEVESKRLIYSTKKCIEILRNKMPKEEAIDYFYSEIYSDPKYLGKVIFCEDYLTKKEDI